MNAGPEFFQTPAIRRMLERAAKIAAVPLSLHYVSSGQEGPRILGWGACDACRHMKELPEGARACRKSRLDAAKIALAQHIPVTFICHLGFACVSAPALPDSGYLLTFGPYNSLPNTESLTYDAQCGLRQLLNDLFAAETLPFSLDDIRTAPPGAVSAAAEWVMEALAEAAARHASAAPEPATVSAESPQRRKYPVPLPEAASPETRYCLAALALLCGQTAWVRRFMQDVACEAAAADPGKPEALKSGIIDTVTQVMRGLDRMEANTTGAWRHYPDTVSRMRDATDSDQLQRLAMALLKRVPRHRRRREVSGPPVVSPKYLPRVMERMLSGYAAETDLANLAGEIGVAPSSITRAIERKIGAKFSETQARIRLEAAMRLLRETHLTATAIGRRVGITDQSNFGKLFRRYAGATPQAYRRRFQPDTAHRKK